MAREILTYEITVDNRQALAAQQEVERGFTKTGQAATEAGHKIDTAQKASTDSTTLLQRAAETQFTKRQEQGAATAAAIVKESETASKAAAKVGDTVKQQSSMMDSALASVGKRLLAVFAVERIVSFTSQIVASAGKIADLSSKTGLSTTAIQKFGYAADLSGASIDAVANAISLMSKNLVSGGGAVEALDRLGLSQKTLMAMEPEQAFLAITDAIKQIKNPMEQADAAMRIFGKGGKEILPAIKAGFREAGDAAEDMGAIMSEQTVKDLDTLGDAWTTMWTVAGAKVGAVLGMLMQVGQMLGNLGSMAPDWLKGTGTAASNVASYLNPINYVKTAVGKAMTESEWVQWLMGGTPAPKGDAPKGLGGIATTPAWAPGDAESLLKLEIPEPVIESHRKLRTSKQEVVQSTRDMTAANLAYLQSMQPLIGVNRDLMSAEQEMFAKRGVLGTNPGFGVFGPEHNIQAGGNPIPMYIGMPGAVTGQNISGGGGGGGGATWGGGGRRVTWQGGVPQFGDWNGTAGAVANGAMTGIGVVEGVGGLMADTDVAGRGNRAWAGAKRGAQIGAAFGPYGALIGMGVGALVGALRNPGFEQEMKRVAKNFGVDISEQLARSIDKLRKEFGGDRVAAEIFSIDKIIGEAGGVTDKNVAKLTARLRDVFVMVETGKFTTEQATQALDKSFGYFAEHLEKSGGLASRQFIELIELNARFGTESGAIADFVSKQVEDAAGGLQTYLENATVTSQAAADGTTAAVAVMFGTLRQQGLSVMDVLDQLGPSIEMLTEQLAAAGLSGGEAFQTIAELAAYAGDEAVQKAATAVDGLSQLMKGLHNGAMLTQDTFGGLSRAVYDVYRQLELQGKGGEQAWRVMQPALQQIWEMQTKFGYTVDEVTQGLIDQSVAAGLVGPQFKPAAEMMKDLLTDIKSILGDIRNHFVGVGDAARDAGNEMRDAFRDGLPEPNPGGGGNGGDYAARGGYVTPRGVVYASQGWPVPRGTDTIPAMLTPGEGVLSRRGVAALGALNGGRTGGTGVDVQVNIDMRGATLLEDDEVLGRRLTAMVSEGIIDELKRSRTFSVVA